LEKKGLFSDMAPVVKSPFALKDQQSEANAFVWLVR
jgi:hypothetical protein